MKKIFISLFFTVFLLNFCFAQTDSHCFLQENLRYDPMRDGIKLYTVIYQPGWRLNKPLPVLLQRTPYGAGMTICLMTPYLSYQNISTTIRYGEGRIHFCFPGYTR